VNPGSVGTPPEASKSSDAVAPDVCLVEGHLVDERLTVGIFIFDGVEVLDFAGPYEVFSRTRLEPGLASRGTEESAPFLVVTVAQLDVPIRAVGGLQVIPDVSFADCPDLDILLIPGGMGTRSLLSDSTVLAWIKGQSKTAGRTTSVCTGSLLLAKLGLLRDKSATTHWGALDYLKELDSSITVRADLRYVDDGIVTSAGISAGIDMAFHIVEEVCGAPVANETAAYMEYTRQGAERG